MATNIEVDETDIKNIIKAFQDIVNNIDKEMNDTLKEIVTKGETYLDAQYVSRVKDPNISDISTSWKNKGDIFELISSGKDVIYEEFGTGDRGEESPHTEKEQFENKYGLKKYNSGPYIRNVNDYDENSYIYDDLQEMGIVSGKFWRYKKPGNDTLYYTQGVPAGQEMWDTRNYLINNVIPKVISKRGHKLSENFKNSIKK